MRHQKNHQKICLEEGILELELGVGSWEFGVWVWNSQQAEQYSYSAKKGEKPLSNKTIIKKSASKRGMFSFIGLVLQWTFYFWSGLVVGFQASCLLLYLLDSRLGVNHKLFILHYCLLCS